MLQIIPPSKTIFDKDNVFVLHFILKKIEISHCFKKDPKDFFDELKENNIERPLLQRNLHIRLVDNTVNLTLEIKKLSQN